MKITIDRKRRSVQLTTEEKNKLKEFVDSFHTRLDCAAELGINRDTVSDTISRGSCRQATYDMLKERVFAVNQAV